MLPKISSNELMLLLEATLAKRQPLLSEPHDTALRLFAGFYEGFKELVVDLYARTLVLQNYSSHPLQMAPFLECAQQFYLEMLPWINSICLKIRHTESEPQRKGSLVHGGQLAKKIRENGVQYAIDLQLNQDTSFYIDTRELRAWVRQHLTGKTVLNTFAYTGSLGVAALAGGAKRVYQHDLQRKFLNVAKTSYTLNGYPINKAEFIVSDFWSLAARFRRSGKQFDCVILDPPLHSVTHQGKVDMVLAANRVINKVRPLVTHNGLLVVINNAIFVQGEEFIQMLETLGEDGFMQIETLIPVPPDCTGYTSTRVMQPPVDPAPFNHPTKIAIMRIKHKAGC